MQFLSNEIEQYITQLSDTEDEVLRELSRETHLKIQMPQMLSGHLQGMMLETISRMLQPNRILEVGTFTGYSAICLSKGLADSGLLYTIDTNEELFDFCAKYFKEASIQSKVKHLIGRAAEIIPTLNETFDLVFIDADKQNYSLYYDLAFAKVRKGGYIIADNVLWSGKVLQGVKDKDTAAIHAYNEKVKNDNRVRNFILPLRDGLNIAVKF